MIWNEPKAMREIHDIRLRLHEKKKSVSIKERVRITNDIAFEFLKRYGLQDRLITKANIK